MYENVKGHPGFIAFTAAATPSNTETQVKVEAEKAQVDQKNEDAVE